MTDDAVLQWREAAPARMTAILLSALEAEVEHGLSVDDAQKALWDAFFVAHWATLDCDVKQFEEDVCWMELHAVYPLRQVMLARQPYRWLGSDSPALQRK